VSALPPADRFTRPLRFELAAQLLREGQSVELPATGTSMRPLFFPGRDRLLVHPARAADARPGDVVVLELPHGLIAHRLLWATATALHTRGDDTGDDPPISPSALIGIVAVPPSPRALWAALRALFR
jgi:hypothetical protein